MPNMGQVEKTIKSVQYALLEQIILDWKLGPTDLPTSLNLDELELPISVKQVLKILQRFQEDGLIRDLIIDLENDHDRMVQFRCTPELEKYHKALLFEISNSARLNNNFRDALNS